MVACVRLKGTSGVMHVQPTVQGQNHSLVFYFQFPKISRPVCFLVTKCRPILNILRLIPSRASFLCFL
jgi:hypothetical protein